jgi:hypothetical protein
MPQPVLVRQLKTCCQRSMLLKWPLVPCMWQLQTRTSYFSTPLHTLMAVSAQLREACHTYLMPGLLSSTSRSRLATKSPSGPMYSLFFTPAPLAAPCAPPPAAAAGGPPPGRLFQLSTREGTGRPPALVLLMVVPRRRLAAAAVFDCVLLLSERAGCLRAHEGMRSSGFVPCRPEPQEMH